jgi:hypothetical protein
VQASIDRELPDLRPEAARLWAELAKPRELPLGMCVVLAPEAITQGTANGTIDTARLRFGLLARPEVQARCTGVARAAVSALPPLRDDPALPAAGDVHLAMALADDAPARAIERAGEVNVLGGRRTRVSKASGDVRSGLQLELLGEVCGEVAMNVGGVAWNEAESLHLTGAAPAAGEAERLAAIGGGTPVASTVERAPIALPFALSAMREVLPELARATSDANVTVSASVESARPGSTGLRGADIVAVALLRGAVTLRLSAR